MKKAYCIFRPGWSVVVGLNLAAIGLAFGAGANTLIWLRIHAAFVIIKAVGAVLFAMLFVLIASCWGFTIIVDEDGVVWKVPRSKSRITIVRSYLIGSDAKFILESHPRKRGVVRLYVQFTGFGKTDEPGRQIIGFFLRSEITQEFIKALDVNETKN